MPNVMTAGRRSASAWKIGLGVLLLLLAAVNGSKPLAGGGMAGALGDLLGICTTVFGGIAMIVWGMPKTFGNVAFMKQRRRLWLQYMGVGFVLMAGTAIGLAVTGFMVSAVLVTWLYWFVWTWLSWRIADRKTVEKMMIR
jgi:hypothetical protein